ncbi:MAG: penicillin-binding protein 1B [Desulfobacterales bacterium]|nr:penicillin-binding protein 1B [Desulfobacterales bacterium]
MKTLKRLTLLLMICGGAVFFGYAYQINLRVEERFKERLWDLPAKVYARPLSLYQGRQLSADALERELKLLGYRKVNTLSGQTAPGSYTRRQGKFTLVCRPFDFTDEHRPRRRTEISISGNRITRVNTLSRFNDMEKLDPVLMGQFYPSSMEDRIVLDSDEIPELLKSAIVAVEDREFYTHYGIDFKSILRAVAVNIKEGRFTQGASTLTQQLAKNFFLTRDKTIRRKISEAFVAAAIERHFTKEEILEAYINEVYLGQDGTRAIHGFGLASEFYFGKPAALLSPKEIAVLVGMLKGPSAYNPRRHPDRALKRSHTVLRLMADQGLISSATLTKSMAGRLGIIPVPKHSPFPFYLDLVKRRLLEEYREEDLKTMGLRIFTPLDPLVQLAAEKGVTDFMKAHDSTGGSGRSKNLEAAVVVTDSASNEIQALVGGKRVRFSGFNRALDARRPIGSLIKPAVFLTALASPDTYTLVSRISDAPISLNTPDGSQWQPRNFDRKFHGEIPLYRSLVHSYNTSTVRLGMALGLDAVAATLGHLGHTPAKPLLPAMLLGSLEMTPVQVAQMYHTLASGGFYTPARAIKAVVTPEGNTLQRYALTIEQRLNPGPVFLVNKTLQAVVSEGTGKSLAKRLSPDLGIAGKTGTTNELRDTWFAGYSGNRLAVVWLGRDDNRSTGLTGATGALQVFGRMMATLPNTPLAISPPENIEWAIVNPDTGHRTDRDCPGALAVPFIKGSAPEQLTPCARASKQNRPAHTAPETHRSKTKKPRYFIDWLKDVFK